MSLPGTPGSCRLTEGLASLKALTGRCGGRRRCEPPPDPDARSAGHEEAVCRVRGASRVCPVPGTTRSGGSALRRWNWSLTKSIGSHESRGYGGDHRRSSRGLAGGGDPRQAEDCRRPLGPGEAPVGAALRPRVGARVGGPHHQRVGRVAPKASTCRCKYLPVDASIYM